MFIVFKSDEFENDLTGTKQDGWYPDTAARANNGNH